MNTPWGLSFSGCKKLEGWEPINFASGCLHPSANEPWQVKVCNPGFLKMLSGEGDVLQLYEYETECLFPHFYLLLHLPDLENIFNCYT